MLWRRLGLVRVLRLLRISFWSLKRPRPFWRSLDDGLARRRRFSLQTTHTDETWAFLSRHRPPEYWPWSSDVGCLEMRGSDDNLNRGGEMQSSSNGLRLTWIWRKWTNSEKKLSKWLYAVKDFERIERFGKFSVFLYPRGQISVSLSKRAGLGRKKQPNPSWKTSGLG